MGNFKENRPTLSAHFSGVDLPPVAGCERSNESRFVRCRFCRSINDTELRPRGDGYNGNITFQDVAGTNQKDPVVGGAGCWFCGSSNYY